ncbi:hypothetical protein F2Q70_00022058 [Brassica cretica]|uniref:Uncharacterized protein n=1 Tax=Brassica cretica TaxID=69181 RepID=A0A8S9HE23_BRACR|nr:hypothetical protein F2Q70_00022058 [Brassica cretica]KAF2554976.1 hypothetical protein F2Q68_00015858 [Brassica cretica]
MREGNGGWHDVGKHDERARSYKEVVINGNSNQPNRERESRAYFGMGKGKVAEDHDHKWVKTAEMGHKRISSYHGNSRGDAGSSYRRSSRREETNVAPQEDRVQTSPRRVERQDGQNEIREETREEGEIKSAGEEALALVSKEFQAALAEAQAAGFEVISDPVDGEEGLQKIQSLLENDRAPEGEVEDVMEMDKIQAALLEHGEQANGEDEKNKDATEQAKKQGTRKRLFKPSINVAGSTKMRIAAALVSPRKRAAAKMGTRKGDTNKPLENLFIRSCVGIKFAIWITGVGVVWIRGLLSLHSDVLVMLVSLWHTAQLWKSYCGRSHLTECSEELDGFVIGWQGLLVWSVNKNEEGVMFDTKVTDGG